MSKFDKIDNSWTLFLDRDGVINHRPINDYVKKWEDFEFLPGVLEAFKIFKELFGRIIIITNQQGIGKRLMTETDLKVIHQNMVSQIESNGGKVDHIFYCPDLVDKPDNCRKPGITMAVLAKEKFPEIQFEKSIMTGDTMSDLQFGINAKIHSVYINTGNKTINNSLFAEEYPDLISFARSMNAND